MNYNPNFNPMRPQQATTAAPAPPHPMMNEDRRRGGVLGGNGYNYRQQQQREYRNQNYSYNGNRYVNGNMNYNDASRYNQSNGSRNVSPMTRGFDPPDRRYRNDNQRHIPFQQHRNYGMPQQQQGWTRNRSPRDSSIQRRGSNRGPRSIRLNDFMPPQLRDPSPSTVDLPSEFNIATTTTATTMEAPVNALPQRQRFINTTQPFETNSRNGNRENDNLQPTAQQPTTTATYRRRQRRQIQQQYRREEGQNRFAPLAAGNEQEEATEMDCTNEPNSINKTSKQKTRLYLQQNRMFAWFQTNAANVISGRGNQAYVLAAAHIYDIWIRSNYELQVWQAYLKMGTEDKHWAKEVIQRTKKRDSVTNDRFVKKKINRLIADIAQASATISDLQVQLGTYWVQTIGTPLTSTTVTTSTTDPPAVLTVSDANRNRDPVNRIEKSILRYIHHCTQHVKKMAETKVQLARAQMEEFKSLEDFEQIATPLQWNIHLTLKPKIKTCSTKSKNYKTATKRVEYDLPPKFIEKTDFSFKVDESIVSQEESQALYDQMRQITKDFRLKAMTVYVQAATREYELLEAEIKQIIDGFPKVNNDDGMDDEAGFAAFKQYHELREQRLNLETEQAIYFLDEQRVEGEPNSIDQEEIVAPTLTRSLGEDFLLQL